jgi:hypothetical protein
MKIDRKAAEAQRKIKNCETRAEPQSNKGAKKDKKGESKD